MATLDAIKKNGEIISLMDGSEYSVNPGDMPICCTWIPTAEITVEKTDDSNMYNYKLINEEIDVSVLATKIN